MQTITEEIKKSIVSSSWIRKMFEKGIELKKKFGNDAVCDFSLGNPDVPPPQIVKDVLIDIANESVMPLGLGYCPNAGIASVREAMAQYLSEQQETNLEGKDVIMTVGAAGAIVSFFRAVLDRGDEIITPAPYFVEYGAYAGHFGGVLKTVPSIEPSFDLDIEGIAKAITPRTRAIIINSPNNPTGAIYSKDSLEKLAQIVEKENSNRERTLFLLFDEPYRAFAYDGVKVPAALPLSKYSCILGSFSKTLSLAGERIGYFVAHPEMPDQASLMAAVSITNRTLGYVNAPVIGQKLVQRLLGETVDLAIYDSRRKLMAKVLNDAGIEFSMPKGAFYFFVKSPAEDDAVFVDALLEENILAVPGKGFGYPGYIRLSCSVDEAIIQRSAEGFKRAVAKLSKC